MNSFDTEPYIIESTVIDGSTYITTELAPDTGLYETSIQCPRYSKNFVSVEMYATEEQAKRGHNKWVGVMCSDNQPNALKDVYLNPPVILPRLW